MKRTMTLAERCKLATDCLPVAEYRRRLEALHAEMLGEIERLRVPPAIPTGDAADSSWGEWQEAQG